MSGSRANLSKEELLLVIDNQSEQIKRFELRLRDTVSACKSLMKQKEALEASLQVLNQQKKAVHEVVSSGESSSQSASNESDAPTSLTAEPSSNDDTITPLRQQISTLTQSLATITAEKVRLEQLLVAEKKSLRAEFESRLESVLADKEHQAEEIRELRLRLGSPSFQGDTNDTSPRRQQFMQQQRDAIGNEAYQPGFPLVERLKNQLRETEARLFALQQTCMVKDSETISLEAERERADRAEHLAGESEIRLRILEQRIAELTNEIGRSEQTTLRDKQTIEKLESKIRELSIASPVGIKGQAAVVSFVPSVRQTATFGTQTDLPNLPPQPQQQIVSVPLETDHSICQERIATLEGALVRARKDFADAVARSWMANASIPVSLPKMVEEAIAAKQPSPEVVEQETPDLLLRPPPRHETTKNIEQEKQPQDSPEDNFRKKFSLQPQDSQLLFTNSDSSNLLFDSLPSASDLELEQHQRQTIQASGSAVPLLFYETELSRLDSALREVRAANRKLERRFRDTEQRLVAEKIALQQSLDRLQSETTELRRATQTMPPDSAKLEFIRQILMRHLSTNDPKVRSQTATVLATALSFPPDFSPTSSSSTGAIVAGTSSTSHQSTLTRFFKG